MGQPAGRSDCYNFSMQQLCYKMTCPEACAPPLALPECRSMNTFGPTIAQLAGSQGALDSPFAWNHHLPIPPTNNALVLKPIPNFVSFGSVNIQHLHDHLVSLKQKRTMNIMLDPHDEGGASEQVEHSKGLFCKCLAFWASKRRRVTSLSIIDTVSGSTSSKKVTGKHY